jgi:4-aminobutyrate aminotransferase
MIGVEFDTHDTAEAVQETCFQHGLLVLEAGESVLRFCPPLMVDGAAVDKAVEIFGDALGRHGAGTQGTDESGG